jgi:acetyl esterase/lipase
MHRRDFLSTAAAGGLALMTSEHVAAAERKTYTYKTVDKLEIQLDVHANPADKPRPVVMWIHGGALITGNRGDAGGRLLEPLLKAGFAVVSIDYRLAPETKLPAILDDVKDACAWVRTKGPELFQADPKRLAVAGGSAGGYLTLTTGYRVEPRPVALVAFWGYGDLITDWYAKPDPFYRTKPLVPKEEAHDAVGKTPIAAAVGKHNRGRFYLYCRQQGIWPKEVAGLDPVKDAKAFDPFCPVRNVTEQYPRTLLIHGTKDTDVPYEESVNMDKALARAKVPHELITVEGAGHGIGDAKPEVIAKVYERAATFLTDALK